MNTRTKNIIADICRVVLGSTFVFSGFVKVIDPWGTAIKITEYLNTFGFGTPGDHLFGLAICLCAAELTLGLMLVSGIKTRLTSILGLLAMTFFLILTLVTAVWFPVGDCGCFGDALKLSPWATFGKNVALWVLSLVIWLNARRRFTFLPVTMRDWIGTLFFAGLALALGLHSYFRLPLVDLLPYKKGTDLYAAIYGESGVQDEAKLVYRDLTDGSLHEFAVSDTTWYDSSRWEFVEQAGGAVAEGDVSLREFAIFNGGGNVTRDIVGYEGRVYILSALKLDMIEPRCAERFGKIAERAAQEGAKAILVTSSPIGAEETMTFGSGVSIPVYNMDATTMMTMLRAKTGIVVLDGGVISAKKNCRDIR